MKDCRVCGQPVSGRAMVCPGCGEPYPAEENWDGWGFEYKSSSKLLGLPLLHISFKYRPNRVPVPARGIVAVGQFAFGFLTFSQFGIGVFSVSQFAFSGWALAQFGVAYSLVAQVGLYVSSGRGMLVRSLLDLLP